MKKLTLAGIVGLSLSCGTIPQNPNITSDNLGNVTIKKEDGTIIRFYDPHADYKKQAEKDGRWLIDHVDPGCPYDLPEIK